MDGVQLWAGIECTVNRTGDRYTDQLALTGHTDRPDDLDYLAELGAVAVRYPVLWERLEPDPSEPIDWSWSDARLGRLRSLGIRPIVGLVHHGSGPRHTNLLDDDFAVGLARYARRVAARYPWVDDWTPINEPVTTARFSTLYGHWYPHTRDEASFWRALLNQIEATDAAMNAIRSVNPKARLIQTDDLGRTYATTTMSDQAGFDNVRRWAGWDLLFGRVTHDHPLWERLCRFGFRERLHRLADQPCPPDVLGINHYLTSDRMLDHRIERYPPDAWGRNHAARYADIAASRVLDPPPQGLEGAIREAWQRYSVPIAVTEVHNGCTREEQLRWAAEAWDTATRLSAEGIDIQAVTAWALLGSQGWDTLLTRPGAYEPGLYDSAGPSPRPTALVDLWRGLPRGGVRHPVARAAGWWRRPTRHLYPVGRSAAPLTCTSRIASARQPLLICGATGTLGRAFERACVARGIDHLLIGRDVLNVLCSQKIGEALDAIRPWAVVNATGWVRVDEAEAAEQQCHAVNAIGASALAELCAERGLGYLGFSSDLVFSGEATNAYVETDAPAPLNAYGRSKHAMEQRCAGLPKAMIVRTAAFFSGHDRYNFAFAALNALRHGHPFAAADDQVVSPTHVPALVDTSLDLLIDQAEGLWHIAGDEALNWADFARRIARAAALDTSNLRSLPGAELGHRAMRPAFSGLASMRGVRAEPLEVSIERFVRAANSVA